MKKYLMLLVLSSLCNCIYAQGEETQTAPSIFDYFYQQADTLPILNIKTDWRSLLRFREKEEYMPGVISFRGISAAPEDYLIKVRTRGNRRKEVCFYPPLRIKFKKKNLEQAGYHRKLNDIKLVLQCRRGNTGERYLFKEQLLYQMHAAVTPVTHQTKLVRVVMLEESAQPDTLNAFLIEEEDEFGERLGGTLIERGRVSNSLLDRETYLSTCFFQYLILNTDWSITNLHNIELIRLPGSDKFCVVPYDFDYAGLVGTHYAVPHESLPITSVEEAYFMGKAISEGEAKAISAYFNARKERLQAVIDNYSWLEDKEKRKFRFKLDEFYELLENDKKLRRAFVRD